MTDIARVKLKTRAQMTDDGIVSRSIKLPQTIDVALRNIKDAKVCKNYSNVSISRDCHVDLCNGYRRQPHQDSLLLHPATEEGCL